MALRTGVSLFQAREILARLRARFRGFEDFCSSVADHAGLHMEISTSFGWRMRCPPHINPRTVRNFPIQSTGAEIMRVVSVLAERRGIEIVAPIHDAFLVECDAQDAEDVSRELDRVMRDAAAVVLRGYELRTDAQAPVLHGQRFQEDKGEEMWRTITGLLTGLERHIA